MSNVITSKAFQQKLGIKQTAFYNWQNPKHSEYKPNFPKPFSLGGRLNGYRENEVNDFIESLMSTDKIRKNPGKKQISTLSPNDVRNLPQFKEQGLWLDIDTLDEITSDLFSFFEDFEAQQEVFEEQERSENYGVEYILSLLDSAECYTKEIRRKFTELLALAKLNRP